MRCVDILFIQHANVSDWTELRARARQHAPYVRVCYVCIYTYTECYECRRAPVCINTLRSARAQANANRPTDRPTESGPTHSPRFERRRRQRWAKRQPTSNVLWFTYITPESERTRATADSKHAIDRALVWRSAPLACVANARCGACASTSLTMRKENQYARFETFIPFLEVRRGGNSLTRSLYLPPFL